MKESYSSEGHQNLWTIEKATNLTNWMYSEIKPHLYGNILEIGSGIGTYSQHLIHDFKDNKIVLSDIDRKYVSMLKERFRGYQSVSSLIIDISDRASLKQIEYPINSVFALNVLEHIENDIAALKNIYEILDRKGKFIMLVPAHKLLFNCIDSAIGHYRRYSVQDIKLKVSKTKFHISKISYFNFLGIFGWYTNGNILKRKSLDTNAIGFYNQIIPLAKVFEKHLLLNKIGLSIITVLEKG